MYLGIPNAAEPLPGLLTGGQPSEDQLTQAKSLGYKSIVNLRGIGEPGTETEPQLAISLGLEYVHIPVSGPHDISVEKAKALSDALEEVEAPTIVHCASGNRVGALLAMRAFHVLGESAESALKFGRQSGMTRLEAFVRSKLVRSFPRP